MRIYFDSMTLPKKAAKRVQTYFTPATGLGEKPKLSSAQNLTAWMLGYDNWHELVQITKSAKHAPSPLDEYAEPEEQKKRIKYQADVLSHISPVTEPILRKAALELRVSAGNPRSSKFSEDSYRKNSVFYWEPYGEDPEWRFRPSKRSEQSNEEIYALIDRWDRGMVTFGELMDRLDAIILSQPENLLPYLYILNACDEIKDWRDIHRYLTKLENAIITSLPSNYPMKRKVSSFNWYTHDNRDYLRSLYNLAQGYYIEKNYKKAKQWFLFLRRCSPIEIGHEKYFIKDINSIQPEGDIHLMEGKELYERYAS